MRRILEMVQDFAVASLSETISDEGERQVRESEMVEAYGVLARCSANPKSVSGTMVRNAMGLAAFPTYLGQVIQRAFYKDYPLRVGDWKDYTTPDSVNDFRPVRRSRTTEFEDLVPRGEWAPAAQSNVQELPLEYNVDEFARAYKLSWRTIQNDDLTEIQRFPQKLLRAALRFEGSFVSNLYDNPVSQASLAALGDNYSQALPFSVAGVKTAYEAFARRTDTQGNAITIVPKYVVTHPVHELTAREILAGIDPTLTAPAVTRVTKGLLQWKGDPFIADPDDWYLLADPQEVATVTVARMVNFEAPRIYMKETNMVLMSPDGTMGAVDWQTGDFESGALEFMVQDIIGGWDDAAFGGITDFQGIFWARG